jgi:hypothetical protein
MYFSASFVTVLAAASSAQALQFSDVTTKASNVKRALFSKLMDGFIGFGPQDTTACPAVWSEISDTLTQQFLADGQCTDAARAAIRAAFHDCFNGACDGSLILADECSRRENTGLARLCENLGDLAEEKDVGVADLIQFAAGTHSTLNSLPRPAHTNYPSSCNQNMPRRPHRPRRRRPHRLLRRLSRRNPPLRPRLRLQHHPTLRRPWLLHRRRRGPHWRTHRSPQPNLCPRQG